MHVGSTIPFGAGTDFGYITFRQSGYRTSACPSLISAEAAESRRRCWLWGQEDDLLNAQCSTGRCAYVGKGVLKD